jgi:hypothetical protein
LINLTFPLSQSENLPVDEDELGRHDDDATTNATSTQLATTQQSTTPLTLARFPPISNVPSSPFKAALLDDECDKMYLDPRFLQQQQQLFHDHVALHDTSGYITLNNTYSYVRRVSFFFFLISFWKFNQCIFFFLSVS